MSDDKDKRSSPDHSRINLEEENEVRYWTRALHCSEDELHLAVVAVGTCPTAVREQLGLG